MVPQHVPTGIKIGVSIEPWSVSMIPARALLDGAVAVSLNSISPAKLRKKCNLLGKNFVHTECFFPIILSPLASAFSNPGRVSHKMPNHTYSHHLFRHIWCVPQKSDWGLLGGSSDIYRGTGCRGVR